MTIRKITGKGGAEAAARTAKEAAAAETERHGTPPSAWPAEDKRARAKGPGNRGRGLKVSAPSDRFIQEDKKYRGGTGGRLTGVWDPGDH